MKKQDKQKNRSAPSAVDDSAWGKAREDNFGYADEAQKRSRRGLEDWEMVQEMDRSTVGIPYWFIVIFVVLLLVAVGLTFPFWGNRPGFERPWFDWGIPAGVAWVVVMSFIIYYFVDLRHILREKREAKQKAQQDQSEVKQ